MQPLALLIALTWPAAARAEYVPCKQGLFLCGNLGDQDGSAGGTRPAHRYEAAASDEGEPSDDGEDGETPAALAPASVSGSTAAASPVFRSGATRAISAGPGPKSAVSGPTSGTAPPPAVNCAWSYEGFSPPPPLPPIACTQSNANQTVGYGSHGTSTCACRPEESGPGPGPGPGPAPNPSVPGPGPGNPNPGSNCGPAEVFTAGDRVLAGEGQLWPLPPLTAQGDFGTAIQFVADAAKFPLGILIHLVDQASSTSKEFVVSSCPHNFTPSQVTCKVAVGAVGTLALRFGQGSLMEWDGAGDCSLTPNTIYYLNVRDYSTPRGTVSTQMWYSYRNDP